MSHIPYRRIIMNDIMEKKKKVILELMNDKTYIPMKFKELAVVLNITS